MLAATAVTKIDSVLALMEAHFNGENGCGKSKQTMIAT